MRAYKGSNGLCTNVNADCNTWDRLTGSCLSCYKGYALTNGVCVKSDQEGPKDQGCKTWDWDRQVCLECSARYVSRNGVCVSVDHHAQHGTLKVPALPAIPAIPYLMASAQ